MSSRYVVRPPSSATNDRRGPLSQAKTQEYVDRVLPIIVMLATDDESRDVVASSLDAVLSLILKYRQVGASRRRSARDAR